MAGIRFSHGGNIYEAKRKFKKDVLDFSANINPLGLPADIKANIKESLDKVLHYPDPDARNVTQKLAAYWKISQQNILLGNGSVELIYLILSTYRPRTVLMPAPTFSEYERAAKSIGSKVRFLKLREKKDFKLDLSQAKKSDVFFVCNPNNPTGNLVLESHRALKRLAKLIVVDEAFMDFLPRQKKHTLVRQAVRDKRIIVLRTLTKFFALPGLRIGYLVAHRDVVDRLKRHQSPWCTNSLAQVAAQRILHRKDYIKQTYKLIEKERRFLYERLEKVDGLKVYPSIANFLLLGIEKPHMASKLLQKKLIEKGILVRDCSNFRNLGERYIRVAVRSRKENIKLLSAIEEIL